MIALCITMYYLVVAPFLPGDATIPFPTEAVLGIPIDCDRGRLFPGEGEGAELGAVDRAGAREAFDPLSRCSVLIGNFVLKQVMSSINA